MTLRALRLGRSLIEALVCRAVAHVELRTMHVIAFLGPFSNLALDTAANPRPTALIAVFGSEPSLRCHANLKDIPVKPSIPVMQQPIETSEPSAPQASPNQYAPHLYDPDPPQRIMTPEESRAFALRVRMLMIAKGLLKA